MAFAAISKKYRFRSEARCGLARSASGCGSRRKLCSSQTGADAGPKCWPETGEGGVSHDISRLPAVLRFDSAGGNV